MLYMCVINVYIYLYIYARVNACDFREKKGKKRKKRKKRKKCLKPKKMCLLRIKRQVRV